MRFSSTTALVAGLMVATVLAGCLGGNDSDDGAPVVPSGYVPHPPANDAGVLLADLKEWAATYHHRRANSETHMGARDSLAQMFEDAGLEVWRQEFENGIAQENIVGMKWGTDRQTWIVVGGHYDTTTTDCAVGCPTQDLSQGIYDDGSGTMMTMYLAQQWAQVQTRYSIAFVGFDGEERGTQGSGAFMQALLEGQTPWGTPQVRGMLDLDMIGLNWPGIEAPINFIDNSPELQAYMRELQVELGIPEDMVVYKDGLMLGSSDYQHFWDNDIPAVFLISDFEEIAVPGGPAATPFGAYPFWHQLDNWDTMVAMAGDEQALEEGFQMATDVAAHLLWYMAIGSDPLTAA